MNTERMNRRQFLAAAATVGAMAPSMRTIAANDKAPASGVQIGFWKGGSFDVVASEPHSPRRQRVRVSIVEAGLIDSLLEIDVAYRVASERGCRQLWVSSWRANRLGSGTASFEMEAPPGGIPFRFKTESGSQIVTLGEPGGAPLRPGVYAVSVGDWLTDLRMIESKGSNSVAPIVERRNGETARGVAILIVESA